MFVQGVNGRGHVVGRYGDSHGGFSGFLTEPDGAKAVFPEGQIRCVNDGDQVAGNYVNPKSGRKAGFYYGFVTRPNGGGPFTEFDSNSVVPEAINDRGQVAGDYADAKSFTRVYGFVTGPNGGRPFTKIVPFQALQVFPFGITASGQVAGYYEDPKSFGWYAFLTSPDGRSVTRIVPQRELP